MNQAESPNVTESAGIARAEDRGRWFRRVLRPELLIALAALILLVDHARIALAPEDAEPAETPLACSIARLAEDGSNGLYGPFSGKNPLVLIHAPLYYRIAGVFASGLVKLARIEPIVAALIAGRSLSIVAFLALLIAIARLSTLDGASSRAALWSVLFVAATPLIVDYAVPSRADLFAIAAQTWGATLLLRAWVRGSSRGWIPGCLAFAVAFCAKQHDVASALGVGLIALVAAARGRLKLKPIAIGIVFASVVAIGYLAAEEVASSFEMINAVFLLPRRFGRLNPAGWGYVLIVFSETATRSSGILSALVFATLAGKIPEPDRRLDRALWVLTGLELLAMVFLCRNNDGGAWINYGLQPVVYLGALAGRRFARLDFERAPARGIPTIAASGCVFLLNIYFVTYPDQRAREYERLAVQAILNERTLVPSRAARERYFVGRQGLNRLHGNRDLIHDEWLYTSFERVFAAEPRDLWLSRALERGPILQVVTTRDPPQNIPGVSTPIQNFGFRPVAALGPFKVWDKRPIKQTR